MRKQRRRKIIKVKQKNIFNCVQLIYIQSIALIWYTYIWNTVEYSCYGHVKSKCSYSRIFLCGYIIFLTRFNCISRIITSIFHLSFYLCGYMANAKEKYRESFLDNLFIDRYICLYIDIWHVFIIYCVQNN